MLVKKLRLQRGWSQEQLAQLTGLNVRTIQRIERGQKAGLESLNALAAVFEISIEQLTMRPNMEQTNSDSTFAAAAIDQREREAFEYVKGVKEFYSHLCVFILVNIGLVAINLFLTPQYLWFFYALFGWGIGLLVHGVTTFELFNFLGPDWEKRQIEKRLGRKL